MGSASSRRPKELSASGDGGCVAACWRPRRRRRRKEEVGEERETAPSFSRSDEDEDGRPAPPPTPSSGEAVETPLAVSSQERLLQLISCFPFPTPRGTPQMTPQLARRNSGTTTWDEMTTAGRKGVGGLSTLGRLVQVSVDTMAITALPIDCWLRERLKSWVQLSGHEGSIVPATKNTLYKKQTEARTEGRAYAEIVKDSALEGCTPRFHKEIEKNDESFIEIEDLLAQFADPTNTAIMDIKIGTRTFLEAEVSNGKKRKDLYEKMVEMDPNEPTAEERQEGAITKMRYMMFRERESSSAQLGFRIEAAKLPGGSLEKNFKKVKTPPQILDCMSKFFGSTRVQIAVLQRLRHIRSAVERSWFFATHEVVGSSLLIMHDEVNVGVWMIDFAKATRITEARILTHRKPWQLGNCEDGYLVGIDNLIQILESDERLKEHAR